MATSRSFRGADDGGHVQYDSAAAAARCRRSVRQQNGLVLNPRSVHGDRLIPSSRHARGCEAQSRALAMTTFSIIVVFDDNAADRIRPARRLARIAVTRPALAVSDLIIIFHASMMQRICPTLISGRSQRRFWLRAPKGVIRPTMGEVRVDRHSAVCVAGAVGGLPPRQARWGHRCR